ncbi:MAG: ABC transporter permease [Chitinophagaceae bacterium]|nr:ABC transporter permease [Chitinophagaceae bacterium]
MVQFSLALVIVIFTLVFSRQFDYLANADPLFTRDNIYSVRLQGTDRELLSRELTSISGVEKVSAASENLGKNVSGSITVKRQAANEAIGIDYYDVQAEFPKTMGLIFLAGNTFPEDATNNIERYTLINETALRVLNFKSADDAIGKQILLGDSIQVQITGVVRNFYHRGMEWAPGPLLLRNRPAEFNVLMVKTSAENKQLEAAFKAAWKKVSPYQDFEGDWLKSELYERYNPVGLTSMLGFLGFVTITIACLGLLGMVTYITQTRYKEIGIRKVMGAEIKIIIALLSRNFLKLVLIAGAIGLPLGYITSFLFLNMFTNRVPVGLDILLISFIAMLLLTILIIGSQVYKVAIANPVEALRNE